jgi:hypothetical protein
MDDTQLEHYNEFYVRITIASAISRWAQLGYINPIHYELRLEPFKMTVLGYSPHPPDGSIDLSHLCYDTRWVATPEER